MTRLSLVLCCILALSGFSYTVCAQTTEFTFQGNLNDGATPASGNYRFEFSLFDALTNGNQIGSTIVMNAVPVTNGVFAVSLDFGNQFNGAGRFIEIKVKPTVGGVLTTLLPRQSVSNVPNALNANRLGGMLPTAFIQNTTSQQSNTNLSISGSAIFGGNIGVGTLTPNANLNVVGTQPQPAVTGDGTNAADVLNIMGANGGNAGTNGQGGQGANISIRAGNGGTSPQGSPAEGTGGSITLQPGLTNKPNGNGKLILAPDGGNVGIGTANPASKLDVNGNLLAKSAQIVNTQPSSNGNGNGSNASTVFDVVGANGGDTSGAPNIGGNGAGVSIRAGDGGRNQGSTTNDGAGGSITLQPGLARSPAVNGNVLLAPNGGYVGVGTLTPSAPLNVVNPQAGITNPSTASIPPTAIRGDATSTAESTIGVLGTSNGSKGIGMVGLTNGNATGTGQGDPIGILAIATSSTGQTVGLSSDVSSPDGTALDMHMPTGGTGYLIHASSGTGGSLRSKEGNSSTKFSVTSGGLAEINGGLTLNGTFANGQLSITNGNLQTGGSIQANTITSLGNVTIGGNLFTSGSFLHVVGNTTIEGTLTPMLLSGGDNHLCNLTGTTTLRFCNSSSLRYKTDVHPFRRGLDLVSELNPITFKWKENGLLGVGLGAEDVARVEPLLAFTNEKGEIEGVRYEQINVVLINAVKEQQAQIEAQSKLIAEQSKLVNKLAKELNVLKKRVNALRR